MRNATALCVSAVWRDRNVDITDAPWRRCPNTGQSGVTGNGKDRSRAFRVSAPLAGSAYSRSLRPWRPEAFASCRGPTPAGATAKSADRHHLAVAVCRSCFAPAGRAESDGGAAAVDSEDRARNVAGLGRREEGDDLGDLARPRGTGKESGGAEGFGAPGRGPFGQHRPGSDGVNPDP